MRLEGMLRDWPMGPPAVHASRSLPLRKPARVVALTPPVPASRRIIGYLP
jgi:hypothetical protein